MTYTQTHLVVRHWASTSVINEPERMPTAAHRGDRCRLADVDCDVTFERDECVFADLVARRGMWVCGHHIDWPEATAFERVFLKAMPR